MLKKFLKGAGVIFAFILFAPGLVICSIIYRDCEGFTEEQLAVLSFLYSLMAWPVILLLVAGAVWLFAYHIDITVTWV